MSETPRTDAQLKLEAFFDGIGIVETVEVEFARELEGELIEARAEAERLRMALEALYSWVKAEADHFGANAPDDDMIVMVSSAIATAKGEI